MTRNDARRDFADRREVVRVEGDLRAASTTRPCRLLIAGVPNAARSALADALELSGYRVDAADDGGSALTKVRILKPQLALLDLLLPGLDGFRVLRDLRAEGFEMPVLVFSTRDSEADKVIAFRLGADGYVTMPCGTLELLARIEALLRRQRPEERRSGVRPLRVGSLEIDPLSRTVRRDGTLIELRPRVFDLLLALARHRGVAISRAELMREVWAHEHGISSRTVDMHVAHLRRQLGDDAESPRLVITVRKLGYRLEA